VEAPDPVAPVQGTQTFGGLVKVDVGQTKTLLSTGGLTFIGTCTVSTEDANALVATVLVTTDENGTQYTCPSLLGGNMVAINVGDQAPVLSYDAGCDQPGGPFFLGGIAFSLTKPSGSRAINGVMSCGVGVLGTTGASFSGQVVW
jgi:hypothetical protein